ncbi:MAG: hypothetical protein HYS62_03515 [Candidatus Aenigmarchaeota archaeon]|nr:hypothetical protein [Candidatus Aenigmarchaeota archaeon]
MVDKFFLGLDYETDDEAVKKGFAAIDFLRTIFGRDFVEQRVGVKLNQDLLTGIIDPRHRQFPENGHDIFADLKLSHGADTGERIIERIRRSLPVNYITVSAGLGSTILGEYVRYTNQHGINVIAFTAHTKIPPEEVSRIYAGEDLDDAIFNLGQVAYEGGCHAIVLEGERLNDQRIRGLPLRKLVTGIRIDPSDVGTQSRVTSLDTLSDLKQHVDYVVISSRYVNNPESLRGYVSTLL